MTSQKHTPPAPLNQFVKCIWYWEGAPQTHSKERLMPNGESEIVINLRNDPIRIYDSKDIERYETYGHALVGGARSQSFVIDTDTQERIVGIQFQPGGAFPFFKVPASEIENRDVSLETLWRNTGDELRERLLAAESTAEIFSLIEQYLLRQLVRPLELHPAVAFALGSFCRSPHQITVATVLDKLGLSHRRFIQIFHNQVGLTPKTFCRVRRFQRVLSSVHRRREIEWAQVALDCGYYDQAHFNHDFQSFSGFTPSTYLARATEHLNHVPLI